MLQIPTLSGLLPHAAVSAVGKIVTYVNQLADAQHQQQIALQQHAARVLTLDEIRGALGATGMVPLNIFQLLGGTGATGVVQLGTHAERVATSATRIGTGALFYETDRRALYVSVLAGPGGIWLFVGQTQPFAGTLSPDQKPTDLGTNGVGFQFNSTDFNRIYVWTGSAWVDAPGQDRRGYIQFFDVTLHADFAPGAGWQLCNGTAGVTRSTPAGGTTTVTVPDLTTDNRYLRSVSGATGGTTGAATHTHTFTTGAPSATTEVQAGTGATVASSAHTHSGTTDSASSLPPSMDMRPYMRL